MSICIPNPGLWSADTRGGATLLAPVSGVVVTTGLSAAVSVGSVADLASFQGGALAGRVAPQAMATPNTHKYTNRPGSPPRGTR